MTSRDDTYSRIGKAAAIIIGMTIVDKVLALAKEMLVAHRYGISAELDVFNVAYALPGTLMMFFSSALVAAFVPLYVEWSSRLSVRQANANALSLWHTSTLFFAILSLIGCVASPYIFPAIGYGFSTEQKVLGIGMERLLSLLILLDGTGIVLLGLLHAKKCFFSLYAASLFINLITIVLLLGWGATMGIDALIWGFLGGTFVKSLYMGVVLYREGFPCFDRASYDRSIHVTVISLALPLLGSNLIANSNLFVDHIMASQLAPGSVSSLRYALRINDMPIQIVIVAVSKAIFPFIAEQVLEGDFEGLRMMFKRTIILLAFLTIPTTCLVGLLSEDIVALLLQRGAFDSHATQETARTLTFYSYGLFFCAYTFVNQTFFSALKDTKPLFYVGCLSICLNIFLNWAFMQVFGVAGIALSTTITLSVVSIIFVVMLQSRLKLHFFRDLCAAFLRIVLAAACMFALALLLRHSLKDAGLHRLVYLTMIAAPCSLCYLAAIRLFRTEELDFCLNIFRKMHSVLQKPGT